MNRKSGRIASVMLVFGLLLPLACTPKTTETAASMGNSNANIANMGFSVTDGDWIYFLHQEGEGVLYKMKKDGTEESEISGEPGMFLNVVEGAIYYVNPAEDSRIYRIQPDGTERTLVVDAPGSYLISDGEMLYYIDGTAVGEKPVRQIRRSNLDGSEPFLITETPAMQFNLVGDTIYYVGAEDRQLHRVKTDGTEDLILGDVKPGNIIVEGDKIYYINDPEGSKEIWSVNTDGTGAVRLSEDQATALIVSGEWIYYTHPTDEMMSFEFKKMKLDGTEAALVNEDQPMILNIHNDLLAYLQLDFSTFSIKETFVRTDGTQRKEFAITPPEGATGTGYEIYQMEEAVKTDDLFVEVQSVYASNLRMALDPANDDPNLDQIGNQTHLFITFEVTSDRAEPLDLFQRVGIIESDDQGEAYLWMNLADVTDRTDQLKDTPYLAREQYQQSLIIQPGKTRTIQAEGQLENMVSGGILFGLFDADSRPMVAINAVSRPVYYVTPENAREIVAQLVPEQTELLPLVQIRYALDGNRQVFYPFEYQEPGQEKAYLLVERSEGLVYHGELKDGEVIPTAPFK